MDPPNSDDTVLNNVISIYIKGHTKKTTQCPYGVQQVKNSVLTQPQCNLLSILNSHSPIVL